MIRHFAAAAFVASTLIAVAPAPASAEDNPLLTILEIIQSDRNKRSEDEIEREARKEGLRRALNDGDVSTGSLLEGYRGYEDEKRRLEEEERRRREAQRQKVLRALIGLAGGGEKKSGGSEQ